VCGHVVTLLPKVVIFVALYDKAVNIHLEFTMKLVEHQQNKQKCNRKDNRKNIHVQYTGVIWGLGPRPKDHAVTNSTQPQG